MALRAFELLGWSREIKKKKKKKKTIWQAEGDLAQFLPAGDSSQAAAGRPPVSSTVHIFAGRLVSYSGGTGLCLHTTYLPSSGQSWCQLQPTWKLQLDSRKLRKYQKKLLFHYRAGAAFQVPNCTSFSVCQSSGRQVRESAPHNTLHQIWSSGAAKQNKKGKKKERKNDLEERPRHAYCKQGSFPSASRPLERLEVRAKRPGQIRSVSRALHQRLNHKGQSILPPPMVRPTASCVQHPTPWAMTALQQATAEMVHRRSSTANSMRPQPRIENLPTLSATPLANISVER
ncbi:hypothetical protein VTG60DRAFT_4953 [Thermothelomyces hinnuleus]